MTIPSCRCNCSASSTRSSCNWYGADHSNYFPSVTHFSKMIVTPIPTKIAPYFGPLFPDTAPESGPPKKQKIPQAITSPALIHNKEQRILLGIEFVFHLYSPNSLMNIPFSTTKFYIIFHVTYLIEIYTTHRHTTCQISS